MRADCTLTEDHQCTRQDIRAFHGDANGSLLIEPSQIIILAQTNPLAAMHVHRIIDDDAPALGGVIFDDGGNHRGLFAQIHRQRGKFARRIHHVGVRAYACQRLFHALELADRQIELLPHPAIRPTSTRRQFHRAHTAGGQGNRTPRRQTFHQHAPALTDMFNAANQVVQRDKHILPLCRAVQKSRIEREMAAAYLHPRRIGGNQRQRDAAMGVPSQQVFGVIQFECQAQQRGDRS